MGAIVSSKFWKGETPIYVRAPSRRRLRPGLDVGTWRWDDQQTCIAVRRNCERTLLTSIARESESCHRDLARGPRRRGVRVPVPVVFRGPRVPALVRGPRRREAQVPVLVPVVASDSGLPLVAPWPRVRHFPPHHRRNNHRQLPLPLRRHPLRRHLR